MLRKVSLLILMIPVLPACSTVEINDYSSFAQQYGREHVIQYNIDGWYQIPVRMERNVDFERPYVALAKTAKAPLYHQIVDARRNVPGLPTYYCDYLFTFDREDRLRSVAEKEESCSY